MFGRAVTAFRNSVTKSKSSNTISNSEDDNCDESIVSTKSLSSASCASEKHRRSSLTINPSARLSLLRRQRRSQSANREGDETFSSENSQHILLGLWMKEKHRLFQTRQKIA